ncbi:hypothetical protein PENSPDRAFT_617432 [Peniophora sp. CONT]|nr:hypothetical protein PENSPDRAFT_617432 [Peniophora sp. CONT]
MANDYELSASQQENALWAHVDGDFLTQELVSMDFDTEDSFEGKPPSPSRKRTHASLNEDDSVVVEQALIASPPPSARPHKSRRQDSAQTTASTSTDLTSLSSIMSRAPTRNSSMTTQSGEDSLVLTNASVNMRRISIRSEAATPPKKRTDRIEIPKSLRKNPDAAASLPTPASNMPRVERRPKDDSLPSLAGHVARETVSSTVHTNAPSAIKRARIEHSSSSRPRATTSSGTSSHAARARVPTTPAAPVPLPRPDFTPERIAHALPVPPTPGPSRRVDASTSGSSTNTQIQSKYARLLVQQTTPSKRSAPLAAANPLSDLDAVLGDTVHLPYASVAYDSVLQPKLDKSLIAFGVQWEIYRGISMGLWSAADVSPSRINRLRGRNAEAGPEVFKVMLEGRVDVPVARYINKTAEQRQTELEIFQEFDREQSARFVGTGTGMGCAGTFEGVPDYYGGNIQQIVQVNLDNGKLKYLLLPLEMKRSNQLARFLGSRGVVEFRIARRDRGDMNFTLLERRFLLCGYVYAPWNAKDGKAIAIETNEDYKRTPISVFGDDCRRSYRETLSILNPPSLNYTQVITKFTARQDLASSTSVPILVFSPEHVTFIDDIWISGADPDTAPAEACLTDGCNFVSHSVAVAVQRRMGLEEPPMSFQGRVWGSKGLYVVWFGDKDPDGPYRLWIRPSALKIKLDLDNCPRTHRILNFVGPPRVHPARTNQQTLLNWDHNGVPTTVIEALLKKAVAGDAVPLMRWEGFHWRELLYDAVARAGSLASAVLTRMSGGLGRAKGITGRFMAEPQDVDWEVPSDEFVSLEDELADSVPVLAHDSGPPDSIYEKTRDLIGAGFHPAKCPYTADAMEGTVKTTISRTLDGYHFGVEHSLEAFIAPDPSKTLKPGEICVRLSNPVIQPVTGMKVTQITGEVLISRNPTRNASDVQKVTAVECPALADYPNAIYMSVDPGCERSLASYLGGGDYDGDTAMVVYDPEIVGHFTNHAFVQKPPEVDTRFEKHAEKVRDFFRRLSRLPPADRHREYVRVALGGLQDRKVGMYSQMHDVSVYRFGYNHEITVMLAFIFCTCLDSQKMGLRLLDKPFKQDLRMYFKDLPLSMRSRRSDGDDEPEGSKGYSKASRNADLGIFVLDRLRNCGDTVYDEYLAKFALLKGALTNKDAVLTAPYTRMRDTVQVLKDEGARRLSDEFEDAKSHVSTLCVDWLEIWKRPNLKPADKKKRSAESRDVARRFANYAVDATYSDILSSHVFASWAYYLNVERAVISTAIPTFAWSIAFRQLCEIKAKSEGGRGGVVPEIAELLTLPRSAVQLMQSRAAEGAGTA